MAKTFLSHTSSDKEFVRKVASHLRDAGHSYFLDEAHIFGGRSITKEIERALARSDVFLLFLSKAALKSKWVDGEWRSFFSLATKRRRARIIPCMIEKVKYPALLSDIKYVDFSKSFEGAMLEVLMSISTPRALKKLEMWDKPVVNEALQGTTVRRKEPKFRLLAKPAKRVVEVVIRPPDGAFYVQDPILAGTCASYCTFGNTATPKGTEFEVYAITTLYMLDRSQVFYEMPSHITVSKKITVARR